MKKSKNNNLYDYQYKQYTTMIEDSVNKLMKEKSQRTRLLIALILFFIKSLLTKFEIIV